MSFIESLDDAGIVWSDYDAATGWPKAMNIDRLVILQYPKNDSRQIALRSTLKGACRRKEIASTPAMAWAGLYLSSPGVPFDKLLETTDYAIDAPAFFKWLKRCETKPSVHVAAWFAKFGLVECSPAPATDTSTPEPVEPASEKPTATIDRGWVIKKAALIKKHEPEWPTINRDFQDASDNGLSIAAKAPGHGEWFEADALNWARQRGKLNETTGQKASSRATPFSGLTHRIKG